MKDLKVGLKKLEKRRTSKIIELGEMRYSEIRGLESEDENLDSIVESIQKVDKEIYDLKKTLIDLEEDKKLHLCPECEGEISINDKFCNGCGASVNQKEEKEAVGNCSICNSEYYEDSNFCFSCGSKI